MVMILLDTFTDSESVTNIPDNLASLNHLVGVMLYHPSGWGIPLTVKVLSIIFTFSDELTHTACIFPGSVLWFNIVLLIMLTSLESGETVITIPLLLSL